MKGAVGLARASMGSLLLVVGVLACDPAATTGTAFVSGLEVQPRQVSLPPGANETFVVASAVDPGGVEWSVSGGMITGDGLFTAPLSLGTYLIQATYAGRTGVATANIVPAGSPASLHADASAACAAMPVRTTGTTYYFCECAAGRQNGCLAGNDTNAGTSSGAPKRSWAEVVRTFNAMNAGDSVALCRGGAWTTTGTSSFSNTRCRAATDMKAAANTTTCDLRDYGTSWGGAAKPIISSTSGNLIQFASGAQQGVRILNLELRGNGTGPGGSSAGQRAIATQGNISDFLICNNTIDGWAFGLHLMIDVVPAASRFTVWGNRIINSVSDGWLGGASNSTIDANFWDNNGSVTPSTHVVYLQGRAVTNLSFANNEIRHSSTTCNGTQLVVHDQFDGLNIENNVIDGGASSTGECWGIGIDNGGYPTAGYYRNLTIRRNLVTSAGYNSIFVSEAPGAVIENNVVLADGNARAIQIPGGAARTSMGEPITTGVLVRNNTIYFRAASGNSAGIVIGIEGTNHVVANNAIVFDGGGGSCLNLGLAASAYAYVDHNLCSGYQSWEAARGTLAAWQAFGGRGFDTASLTSPPQFASPPANLVPAPGSPLSGRGDAARAPRVDFVLRARPTPPSIGAYEP